MLAHDGLTRISAPLTRADEDLIKYGDDQDIWFHVDKLSSAHVYVRIEPPMTWETIPEPLLQDLAQLTKANSIEGNKKGNVTIIYTPWSNIKVSVRLLRCACAASSNFKH